jgi:hypothetical protein
VGAIVAFLVAGELPAQEPVPTPTPPDSVARPVPDSIAPADSLKGPPAPDTLAKAPVDTLKPVDVVVSFPRSEAQGWSAGIWEWDRDELLREGDLTLTELLERIPGMTPIRWGFYGQPEAVSAFGATAGRFEVVLDGFVLDPLDGGTVDLAGLELVRLRRVRVERRLGYTRVELETLAPSDHRPYSIVEAATGDLDTNLFRGTFLAPRFLVGPLALGIERLDSDGILRREPANTFTGWMKWGRTVGGTGLQFELRRSTVQRTDTLGEVREGKRQDWVLRARGAPMSNVTTEAYFGVSAIENDWTGEFLEDRGVQGGVRAAYEGERAWARTALRARSHPSLPDFESEVAGGVRLPGFLALSGDLTLSNWRRDATAVSGGVRAELGPFLGVRPFAELSGGKRGIAGLVDAAGHPVFLERDAFRVGAEYERGGARLGGAYVVIDADSVPAFGLPFDRSAGLFAGGEVRGWEVVGTIPLFWEPLTFEGWYTRWTGSPWIYLPAESLRGAVVYHHSPLASGNLEILARLEGHHRSAMRIPGAGGPGAVTVVPAHTGLDFYLQIRILDVRAFLRWENITNRLYDHDFPGRLHPGQRVLYGVKWEFWN